MQCQSPAVATAILRGLEEDPVWPGPIPFSPGRSPTHLLELWVDEFQPVGINLVQVIAAAPWPIRLGALTNFRATRGHLGRGAFQRWKNPRNSREDMRRGCPQPATFAGSEGHPQGVGQPDWEASRKVRCETLMPSRACLLPVPPPTCPPCRGCRRPFPLPSWAMPSASHFGTSWIGLAGPQVLPYTLSKLGKGPQNPQPLLYQ